MKWLTLLLCLFGCSTQHETIKIITLGDSITKGVRPGVRYNQTFAGILQAKLGSSVNIVDVGISGERTDQALLRLDDVIAQKPAIVTIMYGTNDSYVDAAESRVSLSEYRANLETMLAELYRAGIQPILMTSPRWGDGAKLNALGEQPNVRLAQYVQAARDVAKKTNTPLVDNWERWSGANSDPWTVDHCHPNPAGHKVIAETVFPVLANYLTKSVNF